MCEEAIQLCERACAGVAVCPASEAQNRKTTEPRCKPITLHLQWCLHCHMECFQTRSVPILVFTSLVIFLMCDLLQHGELVQALLVVVFDSCSLLTCIFARGTHRLLLHRILTRGPKGRLFMHRVVSRSNTATTTHSRDHYQKHYLERFLGEGIMSVAHPQT